MSSLTNKRRVAVVGYSSRSLAEATAALGHFVIAVDHFCDRDTALVAECISIPNWPSGIEAALEQHAIDVVLLAGGMENLPRVIDSLAARNLLPALDATKVTALRSIHNLRDWCEGTSILWPETTIDRPCVEAKNWLWKPHHSGGGIGILPASERDVINDGYWQRYIQGKPVGVYFVLDSTGARIVGATEALDHRVWPGPSKMIYRGSMGPYHLAPNHCRALLDLANRIALATKYVGWLQMDLIETPDRELFLLEINPRWTSGMEILRLGEMENLAELHLRAIGCVDTVHRSGKKNSVGHGACAASTGKDRPVQKKTWVTKAIWYAPEKLVFHFETASEFVRLMNQSIRMHAVHRINSLTLDLADIPAESSIIEPSQPVFTIRLQMLQAECPSWQDAKVTLLAALKDIQPLCNQMVRSLAYSNTENRVD